MNKTKGCLIANFATVPFRHINIAEADHFKQFLRQIKRAGLDIRAIC
ncbi:hypothetical protein SJ062_24710 [Escherichia coli]|nr:hypothetical protein [Escherichia coli]MDX6998555.1 hypothetical protein [Escherichia coli]